MSGRPGTGAARIGVIADTHGLMRSQALDALRGCDAIVHAGDIGGAHVLEALATIAPVTAIRGNNDRAPWANDLPDHCYVELASARIYLLHDRNDLPRFPPPRGANVVITGHSHRPLIEREGDVLYLNPGSAGPRRFRLPITVALLEARRRLDARVVHLEPEG